MEWLEARDYDAESRALETGIRHWTTGNCICQLSGKRVPLSNLGRIR